MTWRWAIAWFALVTGPACAQDPGAGRTRALERFAFTEPHMGTLFQIVLYAPDAPAAEEAARAAFLRVAQLDRLLSDYDPASEVSRVNQAPPGKPVAISHELLALLERGQSLARLSGGAFDVTLGPVTRLWRESRRTGRMPTDASLAQARAASGHALLSVDTVTSTVTLARPGMQLDLGGIAKGYAADEALGLLKRRGFPRAMVAASGDLALGDPPVGKPGWTIDVAAFGSQGDLPSPLVIANAGISTSGDLEQHVEVDGRRYSHIVDPATGLGLVRRVAVTVIAHNATTSDALATACSVAAPELLERLAASEGHAVRILRQEPGEDGSVQRTLYGRYPAGLVSGP